MKKKKILHFIYDKITIPTLQVYSRCMLTKVTINQVIHLALDTNLLLGMYR